ncbi:MAG TPA: hypothetical protein VGB85_29285 [Nannocystis sp.]|jgi:hypothetical protein
MAHADFKVFIAGGLLGVGLIACAPTESAGECTASKPCTNRGEACDEVVQECVPQDLAVDATDDEPTPASFSNVALPFFRGRVCMPLTVQPGDTVPVKISPCLHPCIDPGGFNFKKQYTCKGSYCDAAVVQVFGAAAGDGCPADAFGKFDKSQCMYADDIKASAGPFVIEGAPVRGNAQVEVPFLTNDDAARIRDGASVADIWELIKQYPQSQERVFAISMDGANPAAPADCSDESKCDCRDIGF